jgi:hypothetical protein
VVIPLRELFLGGIPENGNERFFEVLRATMLEDGFAPALGGVVSGVGNPVSAVFLGGAGSFLLAGVNVCCAEVPVGSCGAPSKSVFLWRRYFDGVAGRAWSLAVTLVTSFAFLLEALTLSWAFLALNLFFFVILSSKRK